MPEVNPAEVFGLLRRLLRDPTNEALLARLLTRIDDSAEPTRALLDFALRPQESAIDAIARMPLEAELLRAIVGTQRRQNHWILHGETAPLERLQVAGANCDLIAQDPSCAGWVTAQWLSSVLLRETRPVKRAAVVATMRDEGLCLMEWVAHYRVLGFDTIFIYSNDNLDGSDGLLRALAEHDIITYIDNQSAPGRGIDPQRKVLAHALHLLPELWEHEWVFFIDADELFVPSPEHELSIAALLDTVDGRFPLRRPSAVYFNWRWYVSGATFRYEPGLLLTRFQHGHGHSLGKCLVNLRDVLSMREVHFPEHVEDGFLVRSDWVPIDAEGRWEATEPVYTSGQLNHYWCKSFEEFSIKKARGDMVPDWSRDFELFFAWNGAETADNHVPPPPALVAAVAAEVERLEALPGIAAHLATIRARLPTMLQRFDAAGGLPAVFEGARANAAAPHDVAAAGDAAC